MAKLIISLVIKESAAKLKVRLTFSRGINQCAQGHPTKGCTDSASS